jgi:hypothetical protein
MRQRMTVLLLLIGLSIASAGTRQAQQARSPGATGAASWYGEAHRGKLMANGRKFNPEKLTTAPWFYPLGSKVRVERHTPGRQSRSVTVTITDRGPAWDLSDHRPGSERLSTLGNPDAGPGFCPGAACSVSPTDRCRSSNPETEDPKVRKEPKMRIFS